ncbi:MAG TPA: hypothetical protein VGC41_19075 [Kofleriaceae bacterium]
MDLYGPLLAKVLFPTFEAVRGRPTVGLLQYLHTTEHWSIEQLRDLQLGFLRRLLRHAYQHTTYYRDVMDRMDIRPFLPIRPTENTIPAIRRSLSSG